jgi:beta-phosphoglucomutase-like phosphatase (HAD superfamily)
MGLSRCGICGGPFSFHDSSERARIGHPGYMACRAANRRNGPTCTNSGYLDYSHWEAHCLTRLMAPLWEQLLGNDEQAQEVARLQEEANALALEQRTLEAQLERAEARLKELWVSEASDLKQEIAEAAVADLRERTATARAGHTTAITELQLLSAKPTGPEAAWQLREKVGEFWRLFSAGEMEPVERRNFNRWLRSRRPTIEFRACPPLAEGGQPLIELVLDGVVVDTQPLAGNARLLALDEGMVDPAFVRENPDGSGAHIALWEPTLEEEWELN